MSPTVRCRAWSFGTFCLRHGVRRRKPSGKRFEGMGGSASGRIRFTITHTSIPMRTRSSESEGTVTLRVGGETGRLLRLEAGDMLVLPAGVGHRRVSHDERLRVVGAYPPGQAHFDMKRKGRRVPRVPLPETDPLEGETGAVPRIWREESSSVQAHRQLSNRLLRR